MKTIRKVLFTLLEVITCFGTICILSVPMHMIMGSYWFDAQMENKAYTFMWFDTFQKLVPHMHIDQQIFLFCNIILFLISLIGVSFHVLIKNWVTKVEMSDHEIKIKSNGSKIEIHQLNMIKESYSLLQILRKNSKIDMKKEVKNLLSTVETSCGNSKDDVIIESLKEFRLTCEPYLMN